MNRRRGGGAPLLRALRGPATLIRAEPLLIAGTALAALAYATLSVLDHVHLGTSTFDLAIFDQAIWLYSRFEAPASTLTGSLTLPSLLGDHFHPILISLAPLYWLWDDARMLLIAQGVLVAASAIPVFAFAARRLGRVPAYGVAVAYLSFWGIQWALIADFHEVAFAPLLIALAIDFADRQRWRSCLLALALLLLVKENLAIFVACFGLYLVAGRRVKLGFTALGAGVLAFFVITELAIPHFAGGAEFRYWTYDRLGSSLPDAIWNTARSPWLPFEVLFSPAEKATTMLQLLLVPFLGLVLLSRELILAVPLVLERMLSSRPALWGTDAHYSLTIAPILATGSAAGLKLILDRLDLEGLGRWRVAVVATATMIAVGVAASPGGNPLGRLITPSYYERTPRERAAARAFDAVPEHEGSVLAQGNLLPHLSQRRRAYELDPEPLGVFRSLSPDYIVYDARDGLSRALVAPRFDRYEVIFEELGYTVLRRRASVHPAGRAP